MSMWLTSSCTSLGGSGYYQMKTRSRSQNPTSPSLPYAAAVLSDTLEIRDSLKELKYDFNYWQSPNRYRRMQPINTDTISQVFLSYSGDYGSFNLYVDNKHNYLLESYGGQIKEGKYKGAVSKELIVYLNAVINRVELLDTNSFSHSMYACFPYWAAFVYTTDGKKYNFQNNYDNKGFQKIFIRVLIDFPYLLDLKKGEFGDEFKAIKEFYFSEDERSWKVYQQRIQKYLKENDSL